MIQSFQSLIPGRRIRLAFLFLLVLLSSCDGCSKKRPETEATDQDDGPPAPPRPPLAWVEYDQQLSYDGPTVCKKDRCLVSAITRTVKSEIEARPAYDKIIITLDQNTNDEQFRTITNLPWIRGLDMTYSLVSDLTPLNGLSVLEAVFLRGAYYEDQRNRRTIDLSTFSNLPRLRILDVSHNDLTNLQVLTRLKSLRELNLGFSDVVDISWAAEMPRLESLNLHGCQVSDLHSLGHLTHLKELVFDAGTTQRLDFLRDLKNLVKLVIYDGPSIDPEILSGLRNLESLVLQLRAPGLKNPGALSRLVSLKRLTIKDAAFSDLSWVSRLENLEVLGVNNTAVRSLAALNGLKKLSYLAIDREVPEAEIQSFRKMHPNVEIIQK